MIERLYARQVTTCKAGATAPKSTEIPKVPPCANNRNATRRSDVASKSHYLRDYGLPDLKESRIDKIVRPHREPVVCSTRARLRAWRTMRSSGLISSARL